MKWIRFLLVGSIVLALMGVQPQRALADVTLSPTDDAFVRDKDTLRDTNFDQHADELSVTAEGFPSGVPVDIGYLRFDLSGASSAMDVTLRLYNQASPGSAVTVGLYSTADDDWNGATGGLGDETTLTFNNAPAEVSLLDSKTGAGSPAWTEFNSAALTTYVNDQIAGDGTVTLRVKVTSTGMADVNVFEDREDGGGTGNTPELVLVPSVHDHWGETWSGTGTGLTLFSSDGDGVWGWSSASSGTSAGVLGVSASDQGRGIFAVATHSSGNTLGVYGYSDSTNGTGVRGDAVASVGTAYGAYGKSKSPSGAGVYGYADASSGTTSGVHGESDSITGRGVYGYAASATGDTTGVWGDVRSPDGWAGRFTSSYGNGVYISVPAGKAGLNVASGTKNAVVATEDGARLLYAEEATEVWFADYGYGQLEEGVAVVPIDPLYAQTVNLAQGYHVFLQAYDDAEIIVSQRMVEGFEVRLREGDPEATFFYRVVAKRLGHEGQRLERAPWADEDPNLYPENRTDWETREEIKRIPLVPPHGENDASVILTSGSEEESNESITDDWYSSDSLLHPVVQNDIYQNQPGGAPLPSDEREPPAEVGSIHDESAGISALPGVEAADHNHWGESWGGTGTGLWLTSSDGVGLEGRSNVSTGGVPGIYGRNTSSGGRAVVGYASASSGTTYGVYGYSNTKLGVRGYATAPSGSVYGLSGHSASTAGIGVYGYADASSGGAYGVQGKGRSPSGVAVYGYAAATTGDTTGVGGDVRSPDGWAGRFTSPYGNGVYISVPAGKAGLNVASGTKNAVVRTEDGARLLYAEEATEVWFADYGFGQLKGGVAVVPIDPLYAQTVNLAQGYHVFVQVYDDAEIVVDQRTMEGFEVRLREGDPGAAFSYRVVARRLGHEGRWLERAPWADDDPNLYPENGADWDTREEMEHAELDKELDDQDVGFEAIEMEPPTPQSVEGVDEARAPAGTSAVPGTEAVVHDHWGESWAGTGTGLTLISSDYMGVYAKSQASTAVSYGVYGRSDSTAGTGVRGDATATTGTTTGIYGRSRSTSGVAIYGYASASTGTTYGVYGYGTSTSGRGVFGYNGATSGDAYGVYGVSNSTSGRGVYGYAAATSGGSNGVRGHVVSPDGWAGRFTSSYGNGMYISVPAGKAGLIVSGGTKPAVVATQDGARLLYAEEATEVWFADYGFGQLEDGVAVVPIDPLYAQTVNLAQGYHVAVQVYGDAQVYVSQRTMEGFEVRLRKGDPDATFSYRVVTKRLGHEGRWLERAPWADDDPNLYPENVAHSEARERAVRHIIAEDPRDRQVP